MSTKIISKLAPKNNGPFPTHEDVHGEGGFQIRVDTTDRDSIPSLNRKEGMWVKLLSDGKVYTLSGGITNGNWAEVSFGSSAVIFDVNGGSPSENLRSDRASVQSPIDNGTIGIVNFSTRTSTGTGATGTYSTIIGGDNHTASAQYSVVVGGRENTSSGQYSFIGSGYTNQATGNYCTVTGGDTNTATDDYATVGGGRFNNATGIYSVVAGGDSCQATATHSAVTGGNGNLSNGDYSFIGGGYGNTVTATSNTSAVVCGNGNIVNSGADAAFIGGGNSNQVTGQTSVVSGGESNQAIGNRSTVGGGINNTATGTNSTISGGSGNNTTNTNCTVAGGSGNGAVADNTTVNGGSNNIASIDNSVIGGGYNNSAAGNAATIAGGHHNIINNQSGTISGGATNTINADNAVICGGTNNIVNSGADYSVILHGYNNQSYGNSSIVTGFEAKSDKSGQYVHSCGNADAAPGGGSQFSRVVYFAESINAATVNFHEGITLSGYNTENNRNYALKITVIASQAAGIASEMKTFELMISVDNVGVLSVSPASPPAPLTTIGSTTYLVEYTTSTNMFNLRFTGDIGLTVRATATIEATELLFA